MVQDYAYTPKSNSEIDIKICEKKNEIERIRCEILELERAKSVDNTNYINRCFEMMDYTYIYVTHFGIDREMYGLRFNFFECEVEIVCSIFKPVDIKLELTLKDVKNKIKDHIDVDRLMHILLVEN